ncbi:MAG: bifunctional riboflavin kinase/FAD synthetase [Chitinophagaceae bacterium]|nr:bifunctional riboflavin kinase/FAD synthetase [Chitinophagaceae bacterium]
MKLHTDIEHLPVFNKAVVTIGTFDGVHLGHQKILSQLRAAAGKIGGESVIITFNPHPRKIVYHKQAVPLITTLEERIERLASSGIDHLVIVPFTHDFAEQEPQAYVESFLKKRFNPSVVIIGYDHRFGKDRKGDYKLLEEYSEKGYFELREIPQHVINDITVSSTNIRENILKGNIAKVNELLGYDFSFEGEVIKGDRIGRQLGYPTANLKILNEEKIIPGDGIYAVKVQVKNKDVFFGGMMSIGIRPTVGGTKRTIEVNIFDFDEDIYGKPLRVYFLEYLRSEVKFDSLEDLKVQLGKDKESTLGVLNKKQKQ